LVKKIKSSELIVQLHGKILDQQFIKLKVIAISIILMKVIFRFVNQKVKIIIFSQTKQLLIHLVKIIAQFRCKLKTKNGMVAHKLMIGLIIVFRQEQKNSMNQLLMCMINKVIIFMILTVITKVQDQNTLQEKVDTTSTWVVTLKFILRFLNSTK
jgi:hypothetical protein